MLKQARPSVYLDRWVWIRLAKAANGSPREPLDMVVLEAARRASAAGVMFPLSSTHYVEMLGTKNPSSRERMARTMAAISHCRTIRNGGDLYRHQFLTAMHETFGRPAFRPSPIQVFGWGVFWAFTGAQAPVRMRDSSGVVDVSGDIPAQNWLRRASQWAEFQFLAGPKDEEIADLRRNGYRPEATVESGLSRLEWEKRYTDVLAGDPISRQELRVRVQARELIHEHLDRFNDLMAEYRLNVPRLLGSRPDNPGAARDGMVAFMEKIPSSQIAVDLKVELFKSQKTWKTNSIYDIDAVSLAVPYVDALVPDAETADLLGRSQAAKACGTHIVKKLADLPPLLDELATRVPAIDGDVTGWDWAGPGEGFVFELGPYPKRSGNKPIFEAPV